MQLSQAIDDYAAKLALLTNEQIAPTRSSILELLTLRDKIQVFIDEHEQSTGDLLMRLDELDAQLRDNAERIYNVVELEKWHSVVHPRPDDWWWFLDQPAYPRWSANFGWLWNIAAFAWAFFAIGLSIDIGRRFLSIAPGTLETFIALSETSLALLAAGGAFTLAGRRIVNRVLSGAGVAPRFLPDLKVILATLLLVALLMLRLSFPRFARGYNERGLEHLQAGQLSLAQADFERARVLDPRQLTTHYNLGLVHEEMGDFAEAMIQYRTAAEGNITPAFARLARLYIMEQNYSQAASLLELRLLQTETAELRYSMLTALGWARIGQTRYDEAIARLNEAIELRPDLAPAHCLLAQAYEGEQLADDAVRAWEQCVTYASVLRTDEDEWISMAKEHLAALRAAQ